MRRSPLCRDTPQRPKSGTVRPARTGPWFSPPQPSWTGRSPHVAPRPRIVRRGRRSAFVPHFHGLSRRCGSRERANASGPLSETKHQPCEQMNFQADSNTDPHHPCQARFARFRQRYSARCLDPRPLGNQPFPRTPGSRRSERLCPNPHRRSCGVLRPRGEARRSSWVSSATCFVKLLLR